MLAKLVAGLWCLLGSAWPSTAAAHGFGQRYDLPIPLSFYIWSAGATVALSFVGFALFLPQEHGRLGPEIEWRPKGPLVGAIVLSARALTVGMLILDRCCRIFRKSGSDTQHRTRDDLDYRLGGARGSVLVARRRLGAGQSLEYGLRRCRELLSAMRTGATLGLGRPYPEWLGVWPAFLLFVVFAWMELVWSGRNIPAQLATALLVYSGLTWLGMFVFGRQAWLGHGEVFALVFGIFARFAPLARTGRRHPRAAAGGRLARGSSLDDLDGRAGDCPSGDRHIRRVSRNPVMGARRFGGTRLGIRLHQFGRRWGYARIRRCGWFAPWRCLDALCCLWERMRACAGSPRRFQATVK